MVASKDILMVAEMAAETVLKKVEWKVMLMAGH